MGFRLGSAWSGSYFRDHSAGWDLIGPSHSAVIFDISKWDVLQTQKGPIKYKQ